MLKRIWILAMSSITLVCVSTTARAAEEGGGDGCWGRDAHAEEQECATRCCTHLCYACHADGHYLCS